MANSARLPSIVGALLALAIVAANAAAQPQQHATSSRQRYVPKWKKQACEIPSAQNEQSHYRCDDNGDVRCLPGWQGDLCDVPQCRRGCDPQQGHCNRPGECRCRLGFYGERCDRCIPLPGCQNGVCEAAFECKCKPGWDGLFCSEPICRSDCHQTRGYCEAPGECRCRLGWSGPTCKECQVLPGCQHGTCSQPLECKCLPGWTGILCHQPICSATCHKDRGYCRRPGECRCKVGWTGSDCAKCFPYPGCVNGDCRRPWECNCRPGWGGMLCDEKLNYCEENPQTCANGGKCTSLIADDGKFRCECPSGYRGRRCQIDGTIAAVGTSSTTTTSEPIAAEDEEIATTTTVAEEWTTIVDEDVPDTTESAVGPSKPTNSNHLTAMVTDVEAIKGIDDVDDEIIDNEA